MPERRKVVDWPESGPATGIQPGEVQVWAWGLADLATEWRKVLSPEEVERADRFHFPEHRRRFAAARAGLRGLLAGLTGNAPSAVRFAYARHGKPSLPDTPEIRFNLSHTGDIALAAVTAGQDLGVDVEGHRPSDQASAIARRHFSPAEAEAYHNAPDGDREKLFFALWTAKEAVIKLLGSGLSFPLSAFETPGASGGPGRVALPADNPLAIDSCVLRPIEGVAGCSAALATVDEPQRIEKRVLDFAAMGPPR